MLSDHFTLADLKHNTLVPYCEGELVLGDLRGRYNKILAYVLSHYKILCSFFGLKSCLPSMPCSFCGAWVRNHHGIDAKRDVLMRRALQGFITVMTFIAADPGMAHTGSSSVINAKQANHTSGVYSGTQGFGIPLTMDGLTIPLNRNIATSLLLKVNPAHWRKWKRNTQSRRQPGLKPSGIEQLNALALG